MTRGDRSNRLPTFFLERSLSCPAETSRAEDEACEVNKDVNTRMHSEIEGAGPA